MTRSAIQPTSLRRITLVLGLTTLFAGGCRSGEEAVSIPQPVPDGSVHLTAEQISSAGVEVSQVELRNVVERIEIPGTIMSPDTAVSHVGSVVEGRVEEVLVLPGDRVSAGDELLRIHSHELTESLRDLRTAEAQAVYSTAALGRSQELFEAGALSREEVQRRQAQHEEVEANLAQSRERVRHLSPSENGEVVVRAPRSGTVFSVAVKPGSVVTPGAGLVEIGRTDILWATGWVPEKEAVRLNPGGTVLITLQALPGAEVPGTVVRMGAVVDPVRRAVEVRAELSTLPQGIRPGLFATLQIPTGPKRPRATLPSDAVLHTPSGDVVFLEEGEGIFRATPVDVVVLHSGELAVAGLPQGSRVVVRGAYAIRSAMESTQFVEEDES